MDTAAEVVAAADDGTNSMRQQFGRARICLGSFCCFELSCFGTVDMSCGFLCFFAAYRLLCWWRFLDFEVTNCNLKFEYEK